MTRKQLEAEIRAKKSLLCVGLDPVRERMPEHLLKEERPLFSFCRQIVDATAPFAVAFKPNLAFFEAEGAEGYQSWLALARYIKEHYPQHFLIADAKRGDIGNTARAYARAFFEQAGSDAVTVAPYMGEDSVKPFLEYPGKWAVVLALTSNPGSTDFQKEKLSSHKQLYQQVLERTAAWGKPDNTMFVIGATQTSEMIGIRATFPEHFFLVPGVGAQGGELSAVIEAGGAGEFPYLLINASRSIIYAGADENFAQAAAEESERLQKQIARLAFD